MSGVLDVLLFQLCGSLIQCLINRYLDDNATTDAISSRLREVCPSLYSTDNATCSKVRNKNLITDVVTRPLTSTDNLMNMIVNVMQEALIVCYIMTCYIHINSV